jgi:polar amino acid transport system substrate-binding protein
MNKSLSKCPPSLRIRLILLVTCLSVASTAFASDNIVATQDRLTVAVAECPPFVIIEDGEYSGLAVYLWEQVGKQMGLSWDYAEYSLGDLLETIGDTEKAGLPDVGVSCTSVTAANPRRWTPIATICAWKRRC